ncbi:phosphoenolpyruvate--protein phosphotransferase [Shewanella marina]|uniref:phosphoenolpyruvate--protein phosphotransferase n=1 Tax=Shewanella marina TaxID=487319 RepID=UPI0004719120|nr:phosphoenolpyruvate--protein phosphotransferase [Shewanella marina]
MLNTLRDITQAVASVKNIAAALSILVEEVNRAMATQCCSIYLLEQQDLILSATEGLAQEAVGVVKMPMSQGLVGLVVEREEPINLADASQHRRFKLFPEIGEEIYRAFLAVPITYQKKVLGVIVVQQATSRQFSSGEEAFLMTLAAHLGTLIKNLKRKQIYHSQHQVLYHATGVSAGIGIGKALVFGGEIDIVQAEVFTDRIQYELSRLDSAVSRCIESINNLIQRFDEQQDEELAGILSALLHLLQPTSLAGEYEAEVRLGVIAETAVSRVTLKYIKQFEAMADSYLQQRANDIRDLGKKVLRQLIEPEQLELPPNQPVVLFAKDADTTLLAEFPLANLKGIVTEVGGANSHAAIFARALSIPALIGIESDIFAQVNHQQVIVNADRGQLLVAPSASIIAEYRSLLSAQQIKLKRFTDDVALPDVTLDGKYFRLLLNIGLISALPKSFVGAQGVGLYRTEILFMLHRRFPSESEQVKVYQQVLDAAAGKEVVMRTLDVGGDKPLAYFPLKEVNPFLGWRGIRFSLDHPELFLVQLRAMMLASVGRQQLSILLPMVSNIEEIDLALDYIRQAYLEISHEQGNNLIPPKIGVMVEVPSLLYQLSEVADRVDFVSIGTNDLTQYLLAVDRNNPKVAELYNSYHPSVLRALHRTRFDCTLNNLEVCVCGELAGELYGALLLIAMGYTRLSMNQSALIKVKYMLRRIDSQNLQQLLDQVLQQRNGEAVKHKVKLFLIENGLDELVN